MAIPESKMRTAESVTVTSFCNTYDKEDIKYSDFFLKSLSDSTTRMILNTASILEKYRDELDVLKVRVQLSNVEYTKYRYNPKLLSHDLYGSTEMWFMILDANELYSAKEFDLKTVWVYTSRIYEVMSFILNNEQIVIDYNAQELLNEISTS